MKILNFGSMNLDYVYRVDHIVGPGETILSDDLRVFSGGKGLNQSVALARAGGRVYHAGMIGPDGDMLLEVCAANGVDASLVKRVEQRTGNAIIQVDGEGQNSIVLFGGANRKNDEEYIADVLSHFTAGDMLLLQNEINLIDRIVEQAWERDMRIVLNPSPYDERLNECDLAKVGLFLLNEVEGEQLAGSADPAEILRRLSAKWPAAAFVLTLGDEGVVYRDGATTASHPAFAAQVVDTTGAGDTFTGYFLTAIAEGMRAEKALELASMASAIAVSRPGAADSIPSRSEVDARLADARRPSAHSS